MPSGTTISISLQQPSEEIPVSNTPGVLTETTAELAWALLFSVARRIVEGDAFTREGRFKGWAPMLMLGQDVSQKTLGVIGTGRIGTAFALKSKGFHMNVLYTDEQNNEQLEQQLGAKKVPLSVITQGIRFHLHPRAAYEENVSSHR